MFDMNDIDTRNVIEISNGAILDITPLVSVSIVTYNHKPYIRKAIEGALNQKTSFPFEIVIGEDQSTDGTREIVLSYQQNYPHRIRVITSDRNVGGRDNSHRTDRACRGKYIAWCEGDDYWHDPYKLQKQVDCLETHPDVGLVHGGADTYYVESNRRIRWNPRQWNCEEGCNAFLEILQSNYVIRTLTAVARTELLRAAIRDNPECFGKNYLLGDHQRWLLLARVSTVRFINESLATRNVLAESQTHSNDIDKVIRVLESLYSLKMHFWQKFHCDENVARTIRQRHYNAILMEAFNTCSSATAYRTLATMKSEDLEVSAKQYLVFFGAINAFANRALKTLIRIRQLCLN